MHPAQYLRRKEAGEYLKTRYGHGSPRTLAKLATLGGGPIFRKFGRIVIYDPADLDSWALGRLSGPLRSTSDEVNKAARPSSFANAGGASPPAMEEKARQLIERSGPLDSGTRRAHHLRQSTEIPERY